MAYPSSSSSPLPNPNISNVPFSTPHRMPTISAAQALQDLMSPAAQYVSTGVLGLDRALLAVSGGSLQGSGGAGRDAGGAVGGFARGQVAEVWGPPGVGKTALGIEVAANALRSGLGVVWVDTAHPLPGPRLMEVLSSVRTSDDIDGESSSPQPPITGDLLENLVRFTAPTLSHLIALLCHHIPSFPPQKTSLIVIDSLSVLIANAYPRIIDNISTNRKVIGTPKYDSQTWAASRRWSILQYVISSLQKLATIRNIAIVVLNQSVTKMQPGARAILISAVSSTAWDTGIATSIALFRDWGWNGKHVRYARILRANGSTDVGKGAIGKVLAFTIESHGLDEVQITETDAIFHGASLAIPSRKRKADEVMDSEDEDDLEGSDEDYGWAENDAEELPQPPPQWQGSEDILVPGVEGGADDEDEERDQREAEEEDRELAVHVED